MGIIKPSIKYFLTERFNLLGFLAMTNAAMVPRIEDSPTPQTVMNTLLKKDRSTFPSAITTLKFVNWKAFGRVSRIISDSAAVFTEFTMTRRRGNITERLNTHIQINKMVL